MSNTILTIEQGIIVDFCDRYHESITDDGSHYTGNGWEVDVTSSSINAVCSRKYCDGTHVICIQVRKGKMTTELRINGALCASKSKFCDYHGEGAFGLSGGNVNLRYAFFRNNDFKQFLKKHNILSKKKIDYLDLKEQFTFESIISNTYIYTDGILTVRHGSFDQVAYSIANATVIIVDNVDFHCGREFHKRTLKTNINDLKLLDAIIPKLKKYRLVDGYEFLDQINIDEMYYPI